MGFSVSPQHQAVSRCRTGADSSFQVLHQPSLIMFTTSFPGDNSHLKGQKSPWLRHFPGLEELIICCRACLQGQCIPLKLGRSDPSIPPPPQQTWSCRWFCHRGVVVFLALIQNRCREGGFGHPPAPAAHVLPDTWINPFLPALWQS